MVAINDNDGCNRFSVLENRIWSDLANICAAVRSGGGLGRLSILMAYAGGWAAIGCEVGVNVVRRIHRALSELNTLLRRGGYNHPVPIAPPSARLQACLRSRSHLTGRRIAEMIFTLSGRHMVLLHGFVKEIQAIPVQEMALARRRQKEYERYA